MLVSKKFNEYERIINADIYEDGFAVSVMIKAAIKSDFSPLNINANIVKYMAFKGKHKLIKSMRLSDNDLLNLMQYVCENNDIKLLIILLRNHDAREMFVQGACEANNIRILRIIMSLTSFNLTLKNVKIAIDEGFRDIISELLPHLGRDVLCYVCSEDTVVLDLLIPTIRSKCRNILLYASEKGNIECVKMLLSLNCLDDETIIQVIRLNEKFPGMFTELFTTSLALRYACAKDDVPLLKKHIDDNAQVVFDLAIKLESINIIKYLIDGKFITYIDEEREYRRSVIEIIHTIVYNPTTLLRWAFQIGSAGLFRLAIERGSNVILFGSIDSCISNNFDIIAPIIGLELILSYAIKYDNVDLFQVIHKLEQYTLDIDQLSTKRKINAYFIKNVETISNNVKFRSTFLQYPDFRLICRFIRDVNLLMRFAMRYDCVECFKLALENGYIRPPNSQLIQCENILTYIFDTS